MIKKQNVTIKGLTPLLMHRFPLEPHEAVEKKTPMEQAEVSAYRDKESGQLYLPGQNIQRALVSAAAYSKGKGRASLKKQAAASLMVTPEHASLGTEHFEIDSRPVVIAATRGRILRHRPRLNDWQLMFEIEYEDALLNEKELRRIVDDCGLRVGIGDFRPERGGMFGRFVVTHWEVLNK